MDFHVDFHVDQKYHKLAQLNHHAFFLVLLPRPFFAPQLPCVYLHGDPWYSAHRFQSHHCQCRRPPLRSLGYLLLAAQDVVTVTWPWSVMHRDTWNEGPVRTSYLARIPDWSREDTILGRPCFFGSWKFRICTSRWKRPVESVFGHRSSDVWILAVHVHVVSCQALLAGAQASFVVNLISSLGLWRLSVCNSCLLKIKCRKTSESLDVAVVIHRFWNSICHLIDHCLGFS